MKRLLIAIFLCAIPAVAVAFFGGSGGGGGKKLPTGCSDSQIPVYSTSTLSWSCGDPGAAAMVYPGAGVALSTGSAWGTSYAVGTGNNNLVQLNASAQLPAVSGVNLTALNATNIGSGTLDIARVGDGTVTLAKMANMATASILGRTTAEAGVPEVLSKAGVQGLLSVDDLVTLSGVADGAVNLGTFTGSTIADSQTVKAGLQALETAVETKQDASGAFTDAEAAAWTGANTIATVGTIGTGTWNADAIAGTKVNVHGTTAETTVADDDEVLIYSAANAGNRRMTKGNFVAGITSSGIVLDLADDGSNESTSVGEIAVTNDTNSVFSEPSANKLLVDASKAWPSSTLASTVTVADSTDATSYVAVVDSATGSLAVKTDAGITYNASTGALSATGINGILGGVTPAAAAVTSLTATGTTTLATSLTGVLRGDSGVVSVDGDVTDIVAAGSESAAGKLQLASTAEAVTGSDTAKAITPAGLTARIAAPGAIGGTTPGTGAFTDLSATGNTTIGNGDTDTITLRSLLVGGNSRAVQIAASLATPTNATTADDLYVAGNIETAGTVYAAGFTTGTGTDTTRGITFNSNSSFTASGNQHYYVSDIFYFSEGGTQKQPMKLQDAQTATGVKTFQAGLYSGDASTNSGIRLYDGSSNYWNVIAPSGMSTNPNFKLPAAQCANGQTWVYNSGTDQYDCGSPSATAGGANTQIQFNDGGTALGGDAALVWDKTNNDITIGANGAGGAIILYNELGVTDYNNTIQPNAAQSGAATHTLPSATGTILSTAAAVTPAQGGTGVANGANNTITFTGNYTLGVTMTGNSAVTLPTTGTLATLAGTETLSGKTITNGADPADSGAVRLSNNTAIGWEQSTPGTDIFIALDGSDILQVGQNAAQINLGTSGTGNVAVTGDLTVTGADATLGATGVKLTGASGVATIAGTGNTNNENITVDLEGAANTAAIGSSTGVNLVRLTQGIAMGANIPVVSKGESATLSVAEMNSSVYVTAAATLTLPEVVASSPSATQVTPGAVVCVYSTGANVVRVDVNANDRMRLNGTAQTNGVDIYSAGAAGNFGCFQADSASGYTSWGLSGVWTQGT